MNGQGQVVPVHCSAASAAGYIAGARGAGGNCARTSNSRR